MFARVLYIQYWNNKQYRVTVDSIDKLCIFLQCRCNLNFKLSNIKRALEELKMPESFSTEIGDNGGMVYIWYCNGNDEDETNKIKESPNSTLNMWEHMYDRYKQLNEATKFFKDGDVITDVTELDDEENEYEENEYEENEYEENEYKDNLHKTKSLPNLKNTNNVINKTNSV